MLLNIRSAVTLGIDEIDLLCDAAAAAAPYPLRVPSVGHSIGQRRAMLHAAGQRLVDRQLADARGPLGVAEAFAYLLQDATTTLDLTLSIGSSSLGVVLLVQGRYAVLAAQRLDQAGSGDQRQQLVQPDADADGAPDGSVCLAELSPDDAVDELLALIPPHGAAVAPPFRVPRAALRRVYEQLRRRRTAHGVAEPMSAGEWDALLHANDIDDNLAGRLVANLQPVLGNGQMGLATRGGYANQWRRHGTELCWLDTERGRFQLVNGADGESTSVNPLHPQELSGAVRQLAGSLR